MNRRYPAALVTLVALLTIAAAPSEALARPNALRGTGTGVTLGSSIDLLGVRHFPDIGFSLNAGPISTDIVALANLYSLPRFMAGLTIAPNIVIGANIEFAFIHNNPDGPFAVDTNVGMLGIVPFFEYWFDGETVGPFVGAQFGPSVTLADGIDGQVWLTAGARGGVHFFVGDSFSVGPVAEFNFIYRSDNQRAGYEVVLGLSLRGWVGGGGGAPPPEDAGYDDGYAEPAPQPQTQQQTAPPPPPPADNPEQGLGNPEDGLGGDY